MRPIASLLCLVMLLGLMQACSTLPFSENFSESGDDSGALTLDIPYKKFVLDNGLTLIVHEDPKTPIAAVNVWYHVGSKDEVPGKTGFAHLFEHLMFQGSENQKGEYFQPLERAGATSMNGTTNNDRTNYFQNVPTPALDLVLFLESDRMGHFLGAVDQARLDEQREVVKNEKRQRENQPYGKVWNEMVQAAYPPGHPYSWPVIGHMEDLDAASLEDVKAWFRGYYGAANAVVAVSGDVDAEEVHQKVKHYFGDIPAGPAVNRPVADIAKMQGSKRRVIYDKVPQARLYKIWNVPGIADERLIDLQIAAGVLGDGKNSRLYKRLVYKDQIATDVVVGIVTRELGSQFLLWATAKPGETLDAVEAAVNEELEKFLRDGPTTDELERIRIGERSSFVRGLERIGGFGGKSDILASSEVYGGSPDAWKDYLRGLDESNEESVKLAAQEWLGDGQLILEVQPESKHSVAKQGADRSKLPARGDAPDLKLPELQRFTLSNGLPVVFAQRGNAPVVQFQFIADAGFAADIQHAPGTASLTLSMLDEGTETRDALEIADALDRVGASYGAGASLDSASISLSALSDQVEPSLEIYADILRHPIFPEDQFQRLKAQRLASIKQEQARPFSIGLRLLPPLIYGKGHPYSSPMTGSGTTASVENMQRDDLVTYHQRWIRPDNGQLLVVGGIDKTALQALLENALGDWAAPTVERGSKQLPEVSNPGQQRVFLVDKPEAQQSVIIAGHIAPPRTDPDNIAMQALNSVLGGLFTSRINMNLREEKGWSYGARSSLSSARGPRPFLAYSQVQADRTADSMREIRREITDILTGKPVTSQELSDAQDNITRKLPGANETSQQVAGSIGKLLVYGLPDSYYNDYISKVSALNPADLAAVAPRLLQPEELTWIVVGDLQKIRSSVNRLGLGPVTEMNLEGALVR